MYDLEPEIYEPPETMGSASLTTEGVWRRIVYQENTNHLYNICTMLEQRRRRHLVNMTGTGRICIATGSTSLNFS